MDKMKKFDLWCFTYINKIKEIQKKHFEIYLDQAEKNHKIQMEGGSIDSAGEL